MGRVMASTFEVSVEGAIEEISKITQGEATESHQVLEYYDKYAEQYDEMISHWKTGARYEQVLKLMIEQFPEVEKRDKVEILELAAGTGGVGEQLHRHGFRSMDAVDGSAA